MLEPRILSSGLVLGQTAENQLMAGVRNFDVGLEGVLLADENRRE